MTPLKAIRKKCIDCKCNQAYEVKLCPINDYILHPFRFSKSPNRKGIGTKNPFIFSKHRFNTRKNKLLKTQSGTCVGVRALQKIVIKICNITPN